MFRESKPILLPHKYISGFNILKLMSTIPPLFKIVKETEMNYVSLVHAC